MSHNPVQQARTGGGLRGLPLHALTVAALIHPISGVFARVDWRFDLIRHFQVAALLVTSLATLAWLFPRPRWQAGLLALLAASQMEPLVRYHADNPVPPEAGTHDRLRIVYANVLVDNPDPARLGRLIDEESPDLVALVEVPAGWLEKVGEIRSRYPYRYEYPDGSRGLSLWFRTPPLSVEPPARLVPSANPTLRASFLFAGRPRNLWLVHARTPFDRDQEGATGGELHAIGSAIQQSGGSTILLGDLNCTDGSPYFGDLLRESGLRDSRIGFGRQPSWPTWSPYRLSIDHAFVSQDLSVVDRRLGPDIGSDHFPLILDLAPLSTRRGSVVTNSTDQARNASAASASTAPE